MPSFWRVVNEVIRRSDIVLEVLDARLPDQTRNKEVEDKVKKAGKQLIFVLNKCDLVSKQVMEKEKKKLKPSVFVSSRKRLGSSRLREQIKIASSKIKFPKVIIGVLGYPNTGKSSVINMLKGKSAAKTSSTSGFTRGIQLITMDKQIKLLDTPGVFPFQEKDEVKHALIAAINPQEIEDPDLVVVELIKQLNGKLEKHYGVNPQSDPLDTISDIAQKRKKLKKGGLPDINATSRMIIKDWQKGEVKV